MSNLIKYFCVFSFFLVCNSRLIKGQQAIDYSNNSILSISSQLEVFEDEESFFTVVDLINGNIEFEKTSQSTPSYSFTQSTIWSRFKINNLTDDDCYLEISPPILNQVILYQVFDDRIDSVVQGSFYTDQNQKTIKSNNYIFRLDRNANYYLLKIKSKTRLFIKAKIGSFEAFVNKTGSVDVIQGIYAGLIIMILIYNLFLYFTNRENVYLFYLLHILNLVLFFLYMSGYGIKFIWRGFPIINAYYITVINLGFVLSIIFVINFLDTKKNLPLLHKFLWLIIFALITNGIIDLFISSYLAGKLLNYIGIFAIGFVIAGALNLAKKGYKHAKTFLYAWLLYLLGIAVQTMQSLNFIPTNEITSNTIQIGSAFEVVLLSIAVGNKINFYKEKRLEAIANEKILLKEKELLKSSQKENLEELFQEQTELLYTKNKELKKQNKEIKLKHEEISLQNKKIIDNHGLLEAKNRIITNQNEDLSLHKENLEQLIDERTRELKEAVLKAESADKLKNAFLKDFSHEIRTPMNAISGFSNLLMDIEIDDESHDYYVEIINNHTDNLLDLIDNIVDLSRIQNNNLNLKKVKFDPSKMFAALLEKLELKLKQEKKSFVNLHLSYTPNENLRLNLDYNRFWKTVYQLVDNSIKYTEAGYIKFGFCRIDQTKDLKVFVVDTGVGIKKEKLAYVFDSFRKTDEQETKLHAGMGLGLSLVKGLVTLMDGEITIDTVSEEESIDNQSGTSINVVIPNAII